MRATAYVLINIVAGASIRVFNELREMELVQAIDAVSGPYDLIAVINGPTFNDIGRFVIEKIQSIPGIVKTTTCNVIFLEN
jgi:DNA-binding Lrp family transcriptional regulator